MTECWFKRFSERPCAGGPILDPAHLCPKQTLKREGVERVWDRRLYVPACRSHHGAFDSGFLTVPREALPLDFLVLMEELGLGWYLDRRFPAAPDAHRIEAETQALLRANGRLSDSEGSGG